MLQQTQVKTVEPYWERWIKQLPTIKSLAGARPARLHKLWEGLGYYTRVRNMQKAAREIMERHGGVFPDRYEDVLALPGIGRYTAGAICSIAFNQPTPLLDGNVLRVLTRVFGITTDPREKATNEMLWGISEDLVRAADRVGGTGGSPALPGTLRCSALNQSLMELGALVCTPRQPRCGECPVAKICVARRKHRVDTIPNLRRAGPATARRFIAFVVRRSGRFLVRQRPAGVVNAHLWEFPNVEQNNGASLTRAARETLGFAPGKLSPLCTIKHSITRYRITLEVFAIAVPARKGIHAEGSWLPGSTLRKLAFPSAHRRILVRLNSTRPTTA